MENHNCSATAGSDAVRNLEVWQEGMSLVREVYRLTKSWPTEELYGLTAQARRASVSIPANLAEGMGRGTAGELARFSHNALGSAYELDTLLQIAVDLGYLDQADGASVRAPLGKLIRRIATFARYQESRR